MIEYDRYRQELENLFEPLERLGEALKIREARERIQEIEARSSEADFWSNVEEAQALETKRKHLVNRIARYEELKQRFEDLEVLLELATDAQDATFTEEIAQGLEDLNERFHSLRLATLLQGEHDSANALITMHAGAGGTEAQDWNQMLYRMMVRWAEQHGYEVKLLDAQDGEEAGLKNVSFRVSGENAYGYLRSEHGVHRLVRISPFDSSGRRHTSFASVEVLPELDQSIHIEIRPEDLKVDTYRSSGAGGQHVNKTSSAVRLTHLPTGLVVACQNERSQIQNRETALEMLKAKLYTLARQKNLDRIEDLKGDSMDIAWGSQIRSYVFCPYTMVKDHRTNVETGDVDGVMDGDLDPFIEAYLAQAATE